MIHPGIPAIEWPGAQEVARQVALWATAMRQAPTARIDPAVVTTNPEFAAEAPGAMLIVEEVARAPRPAMPTRVAVFVPGFPRARLTLRAMIARAPRATIQMAIAVLARKFAAATLMLVVVPVLGLQGATPIQA